MKQLQRETHIQRQTQTERLSVTDTLRRGHRETDSHKGTRDQQRQSHKKRETKTDAEH